jgi:hypothetical protein
MFKTKSLAPAVAMSFDCKVTTPTVMHSGHRYNASGPLRHRVETYRDVTSVPTFFVRMLGKLLDACI